MTNRMPPNPYAKILSAHSISRRGPPQNNFQKRKSHHGAPLNSRVPSSSRHRTNANNTNRQSHSPVLPVPPNAPPLLPSLIHKACGGLLKEPSPRSPDWSRDANAGRGHIFKPATAPYESVPLARNSRGSLRDIVPNRLTKLSTSSKVNNVQESTLSRNVRRSTPSSKVNPSTPSSKIYSPKNVANARESTHRPSPLHLKSQPCRPPKKGVHSPQIRSRNKSVSPSAPKSKRSPTLTAKRRAPPPPPISLEEPTSPQEPCLNPHQWKHQVRVSIKRDIAPEHASRPAEPIFPLVRQSLRNDLSPRLRKPHDVGTPPPSPGVKKVRKRRRVQFGDDVTLGNPRASSNSIDRKVVVCHPPQGQQKAESVEKPELNFSSEEDRPLAQAFSPHARPRVNQENFDSSLESPTVDIRRQPAVYTFVPRPPPPPRKKIKNATLEGKTGPTPFNSNAIQAMDSSHLHNAQKEAVRSSKPRDQPTRAIVRPLKKRRVVETEFHPKLCVFSDASTNGKKGTLVTAGLDLKQVEEPRNPKTSKNVEVSPISITEAPFELSFEDPAVAELRSLNHTNNNTCLLGNSVKTSPRSRTAAQSRRCHSFELRRHDERMMQEALAAVNIKFEKDV